MDILSKANSTIVEYDNIMQEMMDPSNVLDQEKLASLSKQKSSIQEVYDLSVKFVALTNENKEHISLSDNIFFNGYSFSFGFNAPTKFEHNFGDKTLSKWKKLWRRDNS